VVLHVAARITSFGLHRPFRWRPGCRAAGGLDAVDDIEAIVKNAASPGRDHGDPPAPLQQSAPVGTRSGTGEVAFSKIAQRCYRSPIGALARPQGSGSSYRGVPGEYTVLATLPDATEGRAVPAPADPAARQQGR
jgi:hypothetical protein